MLLAFSKNAKRTQADTAPLCYCFTKQAYEECVLWNDGCHTWSPTILAPVSRLGGGVVERMQSSSSPIEIIFRVHDDPSRIIGRGVMCKGGMVRSERPVRAFSDDKTGPAAFTVLFKACYFLEHDSQLVTVPGDRNYWYAPLVSKYNQKRKVATPSRRITVWGVVDTGFVGMTWAPPVEFMRSSPLDRPIEFGGEPAEKTMLYQRGCSAA